MSVTLTFPPPQMMRRGRGAVKASNLLRKTAPQNFRQTIYDGTHAARLLPPPAAPPPHARRLSRAAPVVVVVATVASQPASPADDHHGHGHHAVQAGQRDRKEPIRLYCEPQNKTESAQLLGFDLRGRHHRADMDWGKMPTQATRQRGAKTRHKKSAVQPWI